MGFRIGFPIDTGDLNFSSIVLVRAARAKYHWCRGGSCSELRDHSGAKFAFEHASSEIQDQFRFEFDPLPTPLNERYNRPDRLCDVGYSDSAACALALAQYQPEENFLVKDPIVLISCSFAPHHARNQGFERLLLDCVTNEDREESLLSLWHKWEASRKYNALALVLHENDAKLFLEHPQRNVPLLELHRESFKELRNQIQELPPIISCKSNQLSLLAEALEIGSQAFAPSSVLSKPRYYLISSALWSLVLLGFFFLILLYSLLKPEGSHSFRSSLVQTHPSKTLSKDEKSLTKDIPFLSQIHKEDIRSLLDSVHTDSKRNLYDIHSLVAGLMDMLQEPDPRARMYAAWILGSLNPKSLESIPALTKAIQDPHLQVREKAVWALGKFGADSASALPLLLKYLEEELKQISTLKEADKNSLKILIWTLGQIGPAASAACPSLIQALEDENPTIRTYTLDALARIHSESLPWLMEALNDPIWTVRLEAVWQLGRMGSVAKESIPLLMEALSDPHKNVQGGAAWALGMMGAEATIAAPLLLEILKDSDPYLRKAAADALKGIIDEKVNQY